jgi:hypothetical protein
MYQWAVVDEGDPDFFVCVGCVMLCGGCFDHFVFEFMYKIYGKSIIHGYGAS